MLSYRHTTGRIGGAKVRAFVVRQPILDRRRKLFACEPLFRSGAGNAFDAPDGVQATGRVINDSMLVFGGRDFTRGRRAFINFPEQMLIHGCPRLLPRDWVAVEVLETVEPSAEVLGALASLSQDKPDELIVSSVLRALETVEAFERGDWLGMSLADDERGLDEAQLANL